MINLQNINLDILSLSFTQAKTKAAFGTVIQRIPSLSKADPLTFTIHICYQSPSNSQSHYSLGDTNIQFPLMSVIKPFSFLYLLECLGLEKVLKLVGIQPSSSPFNSLQQLQDDHGYPRNPMINSGAITVADNLPGENATIRTQLFCQWLNKLADSQLFLDETLLTDVRTTRSHINIAIAQYLYQTQHITNLELALDTYEQICCLSATVQDLAKLGYILAHHNNSINPQHLQLVNSVMLTCGLYEDSPKYNAKIGLPMKSGISGALLTIIPHQGAIASYSPPLDHTGNSIAGLAFIQLLTNK